MEENHNQNANNHDVPADQERKDRQVDNLVHLVEKHTRTQRHLEQYSHIGDSDNKENARDKQDLREKQMDELKDQITGAKQSSPTKEEQLEDLKENYQFGEGYMKNNKDHMNENMLQNLEKKQENRKIQIENLQENIEQDE